MQKIGRKEFVRGVAALGAATAVGISFGKEGRAMEKTELKTLASENAFDLIGKEWMLVTAGNKEKFNTMTASWGGIDGETVGAFAEKAWAHIREIREQLLEGDESPPTQFLFRQQRMLCGIMASVCCERSIAGSLFRELPRSAWRL